MGKKRGAKGRGKNTKASLEFIEGAETTYQEGRENNGGQHDLLIV